MSELHFIWLEIGNYNRFAETKLTLLLGLLLALAGVATANIENPLLHFFFGGHKNVFLFAILASIVVNSLALLPILIFPSLMVGSYTHKENYQSLNAYYFHDAAEFRTSDDWLNFLNPKLDTSDHTRAAALASQIWIIARIARRKFFLLKITLSILGLGWLLSWASQIWASFDR